MYIKVFVINSNAKISFDKTQNLKHMSMYIKLFMLGNKMCAKTCVIELQTYSLFFNKILN